MSASSAGNFYIYSFDGKLLQVVVSTDVRNLGAI
jgi:hypothetical protein